MARGQRQRANTSDLLYLLLTRFTTETYQLNVLYRDPRLGTGSLLILRLTSDVTCKEADEVILK